MDTTEVSGIVFDGERFVGEARLHLKDGKIASIQPGPVSGPAVTIIPGLVDAHMHFVPFAESFVDLDLTGKDGPEVLAAISRHQRQIPPGAWILGRGLSPRAFGGLPDRLVLDSASSRPTALRTGDLHVMVLNTAATLALDVGGSLDIPGGEIGRDDRGQPTGVLWERAAEEFGRRLPAPGNMEEALQQALASLLSVGIVGAATYETPRDLKILDAFLARHRPPLSLKALRFEQDVPPEDSPGRLEGGLQVIGTKIFLDGTLGSRTAWMKEPFTDRGGHGMRRLGPKTRDTVEALMRKGFLQTFHAIGDAAFAAALDLLNGRPGRVEHIQIVSPEDLERVGPYLTASVQPAHLIADRLEAPLAWGDRVRFAYPYRSLASRGATLVFGSDAPVWRPDPLDSIRMAVDRRLSTDEEAFVPEEAVSIEVALQAFTSNAKKTLGLGPGYLRVGGEATFVVFDQDLREATGRQTSRALATYKDGIPVWRASGI